MNAIRSISSDAELKQELGSADKKDDVINGNLEEEKIKPKQENDKPKRNDDGRINISISRKAYCAFEAFTKEFNQGQAGNKKPFTIEEVLEEEILLLFSDEWRK
jgi:hypothetical protein